MLVFGGIKPALRIDTTYLPFDRHGSYIIRSRSMYFTIDYTLDQINKQTKPAAY